MEIAGSNPARTIKNEKGEAMVPNLRQIQPVTKERAEKVSLIFQQLWTLTYTSPGSKFKTSDAKVVSEFLSDCRNLLPSAAYYEEVS